MFALCIDKNYGKATSGYRVIYITSFGRIVHKVGTIYVNKQKRQSDFIHEKPVNKRMLICVACGNDLFDIELSHQKQGGKDYAK